VSPSTFYCLLLKNIPPEAKNLIEGLLERDPANRIGAGEKGIISLA
jgi:serine/threonine protein kinase